MVVVVVLMVVALCGGCSVVGVVVVVPSDVDCASAIGCKEEKREKTQTLPEPLPALDL